MELLILLASRKGELVSRDEIAERLWTSDVFVDTDHGINTAIRKLRHTLRDDADVPVFIQTVTGMGYRFVAPVAELNRPDTTDLPDIPERFDSSLQSAPAEFPVRPMLEPSPHLDVVSLPAAAPAQSRKLSSPWRWIVAAGVLVLSAALLAGWLRRPDLTPPHITRSLQLTSDGREKFPIVVTDGVRVYFAEMLNGHWALSAVPVSGGEPVAIPLPFPDAQV